MRARTRRRLLAALTAAFTVGGPARAQLAGDLIRGQNGLATGTQAPPGLVLTGFAYYYHASQLMGPGGNSVPTSGSLNVLAVPGLNVWYVRPLKILNANYGAVLSMWGMTSSIDHPTLDVHSSYGFGDMYLQPVQLGWHTPYVDVITGFALWIPTGRYSPLGNDNTGQGQWGYEFSAGATVWFDRAHHLNLATQIFYDIYSPKRGDVGPSHTKLRTGDILTLMGGLGYQFLGGGFNIGIPYFVQWKVTEDTLPGRVVLPAIQAAKDWSVGLGAEVDFNWSTSDGVTFRFLQSFAGANTTNGQSYFLYYNHLFAFGGP